MQQRKWFFVKNPHFFLLLQKYDDRRTGKHLI